MAGLIPIVSTIESETFGVMIVNNRVVGLGLYNTGLTALPESIGADHVRQIKYQQ